MKEKRLLIHCYQSEKWSQILSLFFGSTMQSLGYFVLTQTSCYGLETTQDLRELIYHDKCIGIMMLMSIMLFLGSM